MNKKLIFIDNDGGDRSKSDMRHVQRVLEAYGKLPRKYVESMTAVEDFFRMDEDEAGKIIFNPDNAICTHSMYTETHHGSIYQLVTFLETAAICQYTKIIYIDASGNLPKDLGEHIRENEKAVACLNAIEQNFVISFDDGEIFRVRVGLNGYYESPFKREAINLKSLLIGKQNVKRSVASKATSRN